VSHGLDLDDTFRRKDRAPPDRAISGAIRTTRRRGSRLSRRAWPPSEQARSSCEHPRALSGMRPRRRWQGADGTTGPPERDSPGPPGSSRPQGRAERPATLLPSRMCDRYRRFSRISYQTLALPDSSRHCPLSLQPDPSSRTGRSSRLATFRPCFCIERAR